MKKYDINDYLLKVMEISKIGLKFSKDPYALDNYDELQRITIDFIEHLDEINMGDQNFFKRDVYPTPNVSVRTIILSKDKKKVLMVQEASDGGWSLPGGWSEIGLSPVQSAKKEVYEEAGYDCKIKKCIGTMDRYGHGLPTTGVPEYILVFLGEIIGKQHKPTYEILNVDWFDIDNLPQISRKNNIDQIKLMLKHAVSGKSLFD